MKTPLTAACHSRPFSAGRAARTREPVYKKSVLENDRNGDGAESIMPGEPLAQPLMRETDVKLDQRLQQALATGFPEKNSF